MSKRVAHIVLQYVLPVLVVGAGVLAVWALGQKPKAPRRQDATRTSVPVEVVPVRRHTGGLEIRTTGVCVPYREVEMSAEVAGRVVRKSDALRPGRFVREGDDLLWIDTEEIDLEIKRLEAELERLDAEVDRVDIQKQNAGRLVALAEEVVAYREREVARVRTLVEAGSTTLATFEATNNDLLSARKALTEQENLVRQHDATKRTLKQTRGVTAIQLENAELDRRRTTLKAPCTGVVVATHVEKNSHLEPGELVARIDDTSRIEIQCSLLAEDLDYVSCPAPEHEEGSPEDAASAYELPPVAATVTFQRGDGVHEWQGTLCRRDGIGFDERTRTLPVRIDVRKPLSTETAGGAELALVRGMFVNVALHCEATGTLAAIPETAVRPGDRVWVVRDGQLRIEPIRIVQLANGRALIDLDASDASIGDQVVHSPVPDARNGLPVSPRTGEGGTGKSGKGKGGGKGSDGRRRAAAEGGPR